MDKLSLDYIGAFIDAEGCITIVKNRLSEASRSRKGWGLTPDITIVQRSSEKWILELIYNTLKEFGISGYLNILKGGKICHLRYRGHERLSKLVELLKDHVVLKKDQLSLLDRYLQLRAAAKKITPFTDIELEIYEELKKLKHPASILI